MIEDLSKITTIPVLVLKKLMNNLMLCICHKIVENFVSGNMYTSCDLGIGKLNFMIDGNSVQYRFVPSVKFENTLAESIQNQESPLVTKAEEILVTKVLHTYKELM